MTSNDEKILDFNKSKRLTLFEAELDADGMLTASVHRWDAGELVYDKRGCLDEQDFFAEVVTHLETVCKMPDAAVKLRGQMDAARHAIQERGETDSLANIKKRRDSYRVINALSERGEWLRAGKATYYFDRDSRSPMLIDEKNKDLGLLLWNRFGINEADQWTSYLCNALHYHALAHGLDVDLRQLCYYDEQRNVLFWDLGEGWVLMVTADEEPQRITNGSHGVMFEPHRRLRPWSYVKPKSRVLEEDWLPAINFADDFAVSLKPAETRLLWLVAMLAIPFRSILPDRPILVLQGAGGSGKTTTARTFGRILYGQPNFKGQGIPKTQEKGERKFWSLMTLDGPLILLDNLHSAPDWIQEALAQVATGIEHTTPEFFATNKLADYVIDNPLVAVTAITPRLNNFDVAQRLLLFPYEKPTEEERKAYTERFKPGWELARRDALLSELVDLCGWLLRTERPQAADIPLRLVEFVQFGLWVGASLDRRGSEGHGSEEVPGFQEQLAEAFQKMRGAQNDQASGDNVVLDAIELWLAVYGGADKVLNAGRWVSATELYRELRKVADDNGLKWKSGDPDGRIALGMWLHNNEALVQERFNVQRGKKRSIVYRFTNLDAENDGRLIKDEPSETG